VPDSQLVKDVGIASGQVGHREVAQQQPLIRRLVDDAAELLFVGSDGQMPECSMPGWSAAS
jgi:hypothetical protein